MAPEPDDELPPYLYGTEAADKLRVHPSTITAMIARGELRATKVGRRWRIPRADIEAMLVTP